MLRRISYFILGLLLGAVAMIFWANEAHADLSYQNYAAGGAMPSYTQDINGNITNRTLLSTGTVNIVGLTASNGTGIPTRSDGFIVRFYGFINIPTTGTYYFGGQADDGIRIKINNISVVNSWIESGGAFREGSINLSAGVVPIEIMYYENGGGQMVNLQWFMNGYWQTVPSTSTATTSTYFAPPAPVYSSSISGAQTTRKNNLITNRNNVTNNNIYIDQAGDNNTISIEQSGNNNSIQGINQQRAKLLGNGNNITIKQGDPIDLVGKNLIKLETDGTSNTLNLTQGRNPITGLADGAESNGHIISLGLTGNSNNVTAKQSNDGGNNSGHFAEINISGNTNTLNLTQGNNTGKTLFGSVTGNNNSLTASQTGTGADFLDITLTGNGHNVNSAQSGAGNHAATINLTNSGGASSVTLTQGGSTAQTYSIQQSCTNPAGCSVSVTQP